MKIYLHSISYKKNICQALNIKINVQTGAVKWKCSQLHFCAQACTWKSAAGAACGPRGEQEEVIPGPEKIGTVTKNHKTGKNFAESDAFVTRDVYNKDIRRKNSRDIDPGARWPGNKKNSE